MRGVGSIWKNVSCFAIQRVVVVIATRCLCRNKRATTDTISSWVDNRLSESADALAQSLRLPRPNRRAATPRKQISRAVSGWI